MEAWTIKNSLNELFQYCNEKIIKLTLTDSVEEIGSPPKASFVATGCNWSFT